ncbi:MAG TPA: serine/threonine protein kinase [Exiguobacterium sp.]|uniref:serine/threonine-protein kinase n=1 Tax=Exiguobacterium sp. TaxID=44751 RepID=UPI000ED59878|nr:serine/threonine-protein kinase [Exiguobacterium sp.]HCN57261.1 serine/threonine protein kinase [Exiguobacterium sp.]
MLNDLQYEAVIGEGAFAIVSRYVDKDGRKYAVKKLKRESKKNESDVKRFIREIELLSALKDEPNIVQLIDFNKEELWYIMPYAEQNLYTYISKNNQVLNIDNRINIFEVIIDGISIAHSRSILHRDITPNNILRINGEWYICDFGLGKDYSKYTQGGYSSVQGYGSYNYAAPEQVDRLKDATIQSDVYSLGKIFYFILTGKEPRDISDATTYKFVVKGAASEKIEDRYETVSVLKKELLKHKKLYTQINSANIDKITVREYLTKENSIDFNELYEVIMKSNIYDHIYYDFIEPTINYFETINKTSNFLTFIGEDKSLEFIKIFVSNLQKCYSQVGWPFSSLNSFGYFLNRFYKALPQSTACQLECLKEIWELAAYHDQWAIQDLIIGIISNNQIPEEIAEDFAFHIVQLDKSFIKLNKLNLDKISSELIVRAIQSVRG